MTDEWSRDIDLRLHRLETYTAVDEVHRTNVDHRLRTIEDMLKWLVRLVLGALILALIAYLVAGGFSVPA